MSVPDSEARIAEVCQVSALDFSPSPMRLHPLVLSATLMKPELPLGGISGNPRCVRSPDLVRIQVHVDQSAAIVTLLY